MNSDIFYTSLPFVISISGLISSALIFNKVKRMQPDKPMVFLFVLWGSLNFYIGIIYLLYMTHLIPSVIVLSVLMRPANLLQIAFPTFIMWRMGVMR